MIQSHSVDCAIFRLVGTMGDEYVATCRAIRAEQTERIKQALHCDHEQASFLATCLIAFLAGRVEKFQNSGGNA